LVAGLLFEFLQGFGLLFIDTEFFTNFFGTEQAKDGSTATTAAHHCAATTRATASWEAATATATTAALGVCK
jgi:hypothetical protein